METKNIYFISGIDTDAGKSYCTAWYARELMQRGLRTVAKSEYRNTKLEKFLGIRRRIRLITTVWPSC